MYCTILVNHDPESNIATLQQFQVAVQQHIFAA